MIADRSPNLMLRYAGGETEAQSRKTNWKSKARPSPEPGSPRSFDTQDELPVSRRRLTV